MELRFVVTLFLALCVGGTSLEVKAAESAVPELRYNKLRYIASSSSCPATIEITRKQLCELDSELDSEIKRIEINKEILEELKGFFERFYEAQKRFYEQTGFYQEPVYANDDDDDKYASIVQQVQSLSGYNEMLTFLEAQEQQRQEELLSQPHGILRLQIDERVNQIRLIAGSLAERQSLLGFIAQRLAVSTQFPRDADFLRLRQKLQEVMKTTNAFLDLSFPSGLSDDAPRKKRRKSSESGDFLEVSPEASSSTSIADSQQAASTFCSERQGAKSIEKAMTGLMAVGLTVAFMTLFTLYVRRQRREAISSKKVQ